jgi:putative transposase
MARKRRLSRVGYYHVLNRGVAKERIYFDERDYRKFLEIVDDASAEYGFAIYSFCLMPNHYHLLVETKEENLSLFMQKIGSRYTIYVNKRYDRVGPLWQDRFKAYFVYTEKYLNTLLRYIEFNPIKAGITQEIGDYRWAMSSLLSDDLPDDISQLSVLNYELLQTVSLEKGLSKEELAQITELHNLKQKPPAQDPHALPPLNEYFPGFPGFPGEQSLRSKAIDTAITRAVRDGHLAVDVGRYLGLSKAAISKRCSTYARKEKLFLKLRDKGIFWSYRKDLRYEEASDKLLIEHCLKYADFDDIKLCFELFGKRMVKKVWERRMKGDGRFIKTNLMLARLFFGMDVESAYFKEVGKVHGRFKKSGMLAS